MNKQMYKLVVISVVSIVCMFPAAAFSSMEEEINHLLNFIKTSDCVFIRNNSRHDPHKAVKHIEKKYNYLKKRIHSTEDFIKGAATGSSISGKPYMIVCDGRELKTADWLYAELERYRSQQAASE